MPVEKIGKTQFRGARIGAIGVGETRVPKTPGQAFTVALTFDHQGRGGNFDIGVGFAPAAAIGYQNVTSWAFITQTIPDETNWTAKTAYITGLIPTTMALGLKDILKWIQITGGPRDPGGNGFLLANWDQDVYDIQSAVTEFRSLVGSYS